MAHSAVENFDLHVVRAQFTALDFKWSERGVSCLRSVCFGHCVFDWSQ
jgi:hypothetical protein